MGTQTKSIIVPGRRIGRHEIAYPGNVGLNILTQRGREAGRIVNVSDVVNTAGNTKSKQDILSLSVGNSAHRFLVVGIFPFYRSFRAIKCLQSLTII